MTIKKIKPVSNSRRNTVLIDYKKTLVVNRKKKRIRSLFKIVKKKSGRNNQGRITIRHQGGQKKRFYRLISFGPHGKRKEIEVGKIKSIEYNPNSNSFISLVRYEESGKLGFVITNEGQKINDRIVSSKKEAIPIEIGNSLPLRFIPVNTFISNIELRVGDGGKLIRAAGSFAEVKSHDKKEKTVTVQLKSKEIRKINENCMATIGKIGNSECSSVKLGKSGRKRWHGVRPAVRGSAMNPVDHPHGGGEGKASIGRKSPSDPWGNKTLGKKTRKKKITDKFIVRHRNFKK